MTMAWDIVAWTADADEFCEMCFIGRYGESATTDPLATDREGNPFRPVFITSIAGDRDIVCGACFGVIYNCEEDA